MGDSVLVPQSPTYMSAFPFGRRSQPSVPMYFSSPMSAELPRSVVSPKTISNFNSSLSNLGWLQEMYDSPTGLSVPSSPAAKPTAPSRTISQQRPTFDGPHSFDAIDEEDSDSELGSEDEDGGNNFPELNDLASSMLVSPSAVQAAPDTDVAAPSQPRQQPLVASTTTAPSTVQATHTTTPSTTHPIAATSPCVATNTRNPAIHNAPNNDTHTHTAAKPKTTKQYKASSPTPSSSCRTIGAAPGSRGFHAGVTNKRPPYSYAALIYLAVEATGEKRVQLGDIYSNIMQSWAYYRARPNETGWKNSIRHNLTVSRCFRKVARAEGDTGKGGYWEVDETLAKTEIVLSAREMSPKMRKGGKLKNKKKPTPPKTQAKGGMQQATSGKLGSALVRMQQPVQADSPAESPADEELPAHLLEGMFDVDMIQDEDVNTTPPSPQPLSAAVADVPPGHSTSVTLGDPERDEGFGAMAGCSFSGSFPSSFGFASSFNSSFSATI